MEKIEAIVDTCFLQKLSSEGKNIDNIKRVIDELSFALVCHPYIARHEFGLYSYLQNLVKTGYIREIPYDEFIKDELDKELYEAYYEQLYEDFRQFLKMKDGPKQIEKLELAPGTSIYDMHKQGSSMGDVHMLLMAMFMRLPIVLTEDSDIEILSTLAKKRIDVGSYTLKIYDAVDLLKEIAAKDESSITKKDLEKILNDLGKRQYRSEIKTIWNEHHS